MAEQESTSERKLGQNWRTVAIVAVILMVGAVMGHSVLSGNQAANLDGGEKSACSTCPASASCSEKVAAAQPACCASKAVGSGSDEKGVFATKADGSGSDEEGVFAAKAACCSETAQAAEAPATCGGCSGGTCSTEE